MARARITLVAAVAANGVIGRDGAMPWRLSSDLRRFKADTIGRPVIMGRRTFDSIGRPLPDRRNIVVTRNAGWRHEGVEVAGTVEEAVAMAGQDDSVEEICIIGGGEIYRAVMDIADRLKVTHVLAAIDGDTWFPPIEPDQWRVVSETEVPTSDRDSHATRYVIYDRIRNEA